MLTRVNTLHGCLKISKKASVKLLRNTRRNSYYTLREIRNSCVECRITRVFGL